MDRGVPYGNDDELRYVGSTLIAELRPNVCLIRD